MKRNCNHIFESVSDGINQPSYAKCIYCGQIGDDPVRIEHLPMISEHTFKVNADIFTHPVAFGRFNCAGEYIFDDAAHAVFLGHDLNHK